MTNTLERAIIIATTAHAGQLDKAGEPYILHPLRVMLSLRLEEERIAGILHDVIEDCPEWTIERLRIEGFSEQVLTALDALTRRSGEDYDGYVRRAAADPTARAVKMADLRDNGDLSRFAAPSDRDRRRTEKYQRSIALLGSLR